MFEFKLPDLGEGIHEGELLQWHVKQGETIEEDADLMEVETDKAAVTIPAPRAGLVKELRGEVGETLHVGEVVVVIDDGSGESSSSAPKPKKEEEKEKPAKAIEDASPEAAQPDAVAASATSAAFGEKVPAAPATRRLARELGVQINQIQGSGPGGRVMAQDVQAVARGERSEASHSAPASAPAPSAEESGAFSGGEAGGIPYFELEEMPNFEELGPVEREPVRSIRRKVAKKMVTSMIVAPHVAHMDEADVTDLEAFRSAERKRHASDEPGGRLTLLPFVIKAMTALLRKYPEFNSSLDPHREELVYKKYYNIGFAADTPRGLIVPVVKNTDSKSVMGISAEIVEMALAAREGKIDAADLRGGSFTITNVGPLGGTGLIPTINHPEVAILGMGRVQEKPVVRDGEIVIRKMLPLTLAFDHRVADGASAARMVTELIRLLGDPHQLLLEA